MTPVELDRVGRVLDRHRRIPERVVVAAHVVHPVAEHAVGGEERGVLLLGARVREVALDDDCVGIEPRDLGDHGVVHHLGVRRLTRRGAAGSVRRVGVGVARSGRTPSRRSARRSRSRSSRAGGLPDARACGPSAGRYSPRRGAVDRERVLGAGFEPGDAGRVVRPGRGDDSRRRPASRPRRPGSLTNVTTTSSGPTVMSSALSTIGGSRAGSARGVRRATGARCGPTAATVRAGSRPARAPSREPRTHSCSGASASEPATAAVLVTAASAATIAATSSGVASGEITRSCGRVGPPPGIRAGRSRACAAGAARASSAACRASARARDACRAGR